MFKFHNVINFWKKNGNLAKHDRIELTYFELNGQKLKLWYYWLIWFVINNVTLKKLAIFAKKNGIRSTFHLHNVIHFSKKLRNLAKHNAGT